MPAHVPEGDIRQLWKENTDRSWSGLLKVVESHRNKTGGIENTVVEMLIPVCRQLEHSGTPYPNTEQEFAKVLNGAMAKKFAA
ncbi:MAG TPA: hypothetical protein VFZ25_01155 [Chloroflexota bacterium]|nr:hypothetical protein [Chloroflexota bacterium]